MIVAFLLVVALPGLLVAAAVYDLMSYTIPNPITGAMILLFAAFVVVVVFTGQAPGWTAIGWHLLAGFLGLAVGMAMFAAGWIGGGDAKLFAAALLWLGWDVLLDYAVIASLLGGLLTLVLLLLRQIPLPIFLVRQSWIARLSDPKAGVPYGVALAIAALLVLPDTQFFDIVSAR
jgi:prepilin peptidase CpaA